MMTLDKQIEEAMELNKQCVALYEAALRHALERIAQLERAAEERDYEQAQIRYKRRVGAA